MKKTETQISQDLAFVILNFLKNENGINRTNQDSILDESMSIVRNVITMAERFVLQEESESSSDKKQPSNVNEKRIIEAAKKADDLVEKAVVQARKEAKLYHNGNINRHKLMKRVRHIIKNTFKDVEGIDLSGVDVDFSDDKCEIIIPKD